MDDATTDRQAPRRGIQVTLREKELKDGSKSLYLDYYPPIPHPKKPGQYTRREFLGIYILPNDSESDQDRKRLDARKLEIQRQRAYGTSSKKVQGALNELRAKTTLPAFMRKVASDDPEFSDSTRKGWEIAATALEYYLEEQGIDPASTTFDQLDEGFIDGLRTFFLTEARDRRRLKAEGITKVVKKDAPKLKKTTAAGYFNTVIAALRRAHRERPQYLSRPIYEGIKRINAKAGRKTYLTREEVIRLVATPCPDPLLRRAALFSILTGFRFSDIEGLKWSDVELLDGQVTITKLIKKTDQLERVPITADAASLLLPPGETGESGEDVRKTNNDGLFVPPPSWWNVVKDGEARPFAPLRYSTALNPKLQVWCARAGIEKDITFHSLRHTFAVLQIEAGTDLFTLSKLMTHATPDVTGRVYADVVDKKKREAAQRIDISIR